MSKVKVSLRPMRVFSEQLKKKIVSDLEKGRVNVIGVSREYQVSCTSIYGWLKKYSSHLQSSAKLVVQMDSEQYKAKELQKRVADLEAALGRKQMEVDFLNKLIEVANEDMGIDLKKNINTPALHGSKKIKGSKAS